MRVCGREGKGANQQVGNVRISTASVARCAFVGVPSVYDPSMGMHSGAQADMSSSQTRPAPSRKLTYVGDPAQDGQDDAEHDLQHGLHLGCRGVLPTLWVCSILEAFRAYLCSPYHTLT